MFQFYISYDSFLICKIKYYLPLTMLTKIIYLNKVMVTFDAYVYQNFDPIGFPKVKRAANNRKEKFVHEEGFMISMISTDINPSELKSFAVKHFN